MRAAIMPILLLCAAVPAFSQQQYFPRGVFDGNQRTDKFVNNWYAGNLKSLKEPSLWELSQQNKKAVVYRFLYIPTFTHAFSIRVVFREDGTAALVYKVQSGKGGYNPGHLSRTLTSRLSSVEATNLLIRISAVEFWKLPTEDPKAPNGMDGSQWIIEGVRSGKYHVVDRWTPEMGKYRGLGLYFMDDLMGLNMPKDEVY
jgi:hypothetical protein